MNTQTYKFDTKYTLGSTEEQCKDGNIVNDAFEALPYKKYIAWVDENWDRMSEYEQSVAENIEYNIKEQLY